MNRLVRSLAPAVLFISIAGHSWCEERPAFVPTLPEGAICEVAVEGLHPTQMSVGCREVHMRAARLATMKRKKLDAYLEEHIVPIVIGPKGVPYILDHHHLAAVLVETKLRKTVACRVMHNASALNEDDFWKLLSEHHWLHPYDEKGRGPLSVTLLPAGVTGLKDDPSRSLAWAVREAGGYQKRDDVPYADFQWADFFRTQLPYEDTDAGFAAAIPKGVELAKSPAAKNLPGYLGAPN